ncbi:MAG: GGDEF domain-containing protein [Gemmatimonadales bacterium]|nr:MAG: GGDEF domain-containing protein [Gemmatimonadales bacterium]
MLANGAEIRVSREARTLPLPDGMTTKTADKQKFWQSPDSTLLSPAGEGELIISRVRSIIAIAGFSLAMVAAFRNPLSIDLRIYQAVLTLATAISLAIHLLVRRVVYDWWVGFVASIADVTLVSVGLSVFLIAGSPELALNSTILFPAYFYALSVTTVRLDHRACLVAGVAASVQYLGIVGFAAAKYGLSAEFINVEVQGVRVALLMGMAMLGVVVNKRMQRPHVLSANDSLTGLLNRRAFADRWDSELARARRYGRPISIAVIDIDYFKQFNDQHGHSGGDAALVAVALALRGRVRDSDFIGRLGGEEFIVAFPETGSEAAQSCAEGLRKAVAESPLMMPSGRATTSVTVSIGVATWPEHGEELSRLQERADDRMYQAKLAGKNRVIGPGPSARSTDALVPH